MATTFSKLIVNGSLINRLDLVESKMMQQSKILFIPQTLGSLKSARKAISADKRIEVYLPSSLKEWQNKIKSFKPELSLGTRFHGNIAALSMGVPTVFMSGDIRASEITSLAHLPFLEDITDISAAIKQFHSINPLARDNAIFAAKQELAACLERIS